MESCKVGPWWWQKQAGFYSETAQLREGVVRGGAEGRRTPPHPCKKEEKMWTRPLSLLRGEERYEKG